MLRHVLMCVVPRRLHHHEPTHEVINNSRSQVHTPFLLEYVEVLCFYSSNGVLNLSGVRCGSGEIYRVRAPLVFLTHINDMSCIGQRRPWDKDHLRGSL